MGFLRVFLPHTSSSSNSSTTILLLLINFIVVISLFAHFATGLKCWCLPDYEWAEASGCDEKKMIMTCDKKYDVCQYQLASPISPVWQASCGLKSKVTSEEWQLPQCTVGGVQKSCWCNKDCCNAPDAKPGNCSAKPKTIARI